jgi:hypothetical protein
MQMSAMSESQCTIDRFFEDTVNPLLRQPWINRSEGIISIMSRMTHGAPAPYTYLDHTMKLLCVTIEGVENHDFRWSLSDIQAYPFEGNPKFNYLSTDGSNIYGCVKFLLTYTWKTTGYGRLSIRTKRHRNGKIEVFVGETVSHRFCVDPDCLGY